MSSTNNGDPDHRLKNSRKLFMVLSPRALPYATLALKSLFSNAVELIHLSLITDSESDKERLSAELSALKNFGGGADRWSVFSAADLDEREDVHFAKFKHLRSFRRGHPCWRKITDPLLLAEAGQEMILLDPDLYFPNRFRFEPTPETGILLMWQKPCCLLPPEVVQAAIAAKVRLAHHVDIGVAHWRQPVDLEWLNWLIGTLEAPRLPRSMHVEAIVWAALAMRMGGGYLDPRFWVCWRRSQYKRMLRKLGASGTFILRFEDLARIKCFHAGGEAKWWLPEAHALGMLDRNSEVTETGATLPFVELTSGEYNALQRNRLWLRRLGYYAIFRP
jgi:hypothetical protein